MIYHFGRLHFDVKGVSVGITTLSSAASEREYEKQEYSSLRDVLYIHIKPQTSTFRVLIQA